MLLRRQTHFLKAVSLSRIGIFSGVDPAHEHLKGTRVYLKRRIQLLVYHHLHTVLRVARQRDDLVQFSLEMSVDFLWSGIWSHTAVIPSFYFLCDKNFLCKTFTDYSILFSMICHLFITIKTPVIISKVLEIIMDPLSYLTSYF